MFRRKRKTEKDVMISMKVYRSKYRPEKKLEELLEEVWEIKKKHPDINFNIEVIN